LRVKKCTLSLFSQIVVGQFTQSGKAWQKCAQQPDKSLSNTNSAVSLQVYVGLHALPVQHLHSVFFGIWFGVVQHQKQPGCREGKKID